MNSQRVTRAISWASVVLPTPGGPHRMSERQLVALDLPAQRLARAQDVLLADVLSRLLRAHALGQRTLAVGAANRVGRGGVEQAHGCSILWRRASYSRMPAATAAFSDSTPTVGIETSTRRGAQSSAHAVRLAADNQGAAARQVGGRQRAAPASRRRTAWRRRARPRSAAACASAVAASRRRTGTERGTATRRRAQRLGVVRARRALQEQDAGGAERLGGAHDGAGVARVLKPVQHHHQRACREAVAANFHSRRPHQRHHALAGFRGGDCLRKARPAARPPSRRPDAARALRPRRARLPRPAPP